VHSGITPVYNHAIFTRTTDPVSSDTCKAQT
jgi:hypothetical protein